MGGEDRDGPGELATATAGARLRGQLLTGRPARSPGEVVRHLLAVQAQDLVGARLSVRARSSGLTTRDVDAALDRRELVVTWLNRGTLHLVTAADYWWLHPLTAPRTLTGVTRRLRQEGVSADQVEQGLATVVEAIRGEGPRTRAQLKLRLDEAGVPTAGQALVHVLAAASLAGLVVRGPMVGVDQGYVLVEDWLGPAPAAVDRFEALARLAASYRAGHACASAADLAAWAGITLGDARAGWAATSDADPSGRLADRRDALPDPVLLGPFDPALHGWPDREWLLGRYRRVVTRNGIFRPTALAGGRVVGTWTRPGGQVALELFEDVDPDLRQAFADDATDVARFLTEPGSPT
jgi:hypothetical protein